MQVNGVVDVDFSLSCAWMRQCCVDGQFQECGFDCIDSGAWSNFTGNGKNQPVKLKQKVLRPY